MKRSVGLALAVITTLPGRAVSQELEPRSYSVSPVGANFVAVGYGYNTGGVLFDPSLPVTDAHADINAVSIGYGRTLDIGGMQGLITGGLPYAWGVLTGMVEGQGDMITRSGIGDARIKLSLNIIGSPALTPQQFAKAPAQPFVLGASLLAVVPIGQYYPSHLINIGTNRWAFKPELGASYNFNKKLYLDFYTGVWLFADNTQVYPGSSVSSQNPLLSMQAHVSYTFNKRLWAAIQSTWYVGGNTTTNNGMPSPREDNSRLGAQVSFMIVPGQSVKASYSDGATARIGSDFSSFGLAYQFLWF